MNIFESAIQNIDCLWPKLQEHLTKIELNKNIIYNNAEIKGRMYVIPDDYEHTLRMKEHQDSDTGHYFQLEISGSK